MNWIVRLVQGIGFLAIATTLLPLWRTTRWWVRLWDFPRFQIAMLAIVVLALLPIIRPPAGSFDWIFLGTLLAVILWQFTWVGPYFPGAPRSVKSCGENNSNANRISLLTTNVLQTNRSTNRLLEVIGRAGPDLILAVEVDEWWVERLAEGLRSRYTYDLLYPLSNGYGLALFSRLELIDAKVRFVLDEAIPSIRTGVRLRSGAVVTVYGVHPRPPSVLQSSTERDVELLRIGLEIKGHGKPSIVLGDLNDVAWSPTTLELMRTGDLLDPRRGRGFYNTYPARWPGLRYPLDYVFNTRHFHVCRMQVLPTFGSDHLPLIVELKLDSGG
jgi:endonuclease/exonuclease/phosphatase (EEP) superfamily protein YafD